MLVLVQIRHMRVNSPAGTRSGVMQDLKGAASLTLLLGLTWTAGFFTWGPARIALLYLFAVLNSLQGETAHFGVTFGLFSLSLSLLKMSMLD